MCSIASLDTTTSKLFDAMPSDVSVPTTARQPQRGVVFGRQIRPDVERDDVGACGDQRARHATDAAAAVERAAPPQPVGSEEPR